MQHHFNTEIAKEYGILEAILLEHFYFWISKNIANNKHFYEGNYWTYNSIKAFSTLFDYVSEKQIKYAINKLITNELIITGNFNQDSMDRTLWYALTEKGMNLFQNCQMHLTNLSNANDEIVKPIPYNKQSYNKNNNINNNIKEKENIIKEKERPIFKQKEVKFEIVEKEEPITITDEEQIFNHWNSKEIVKHRELTKPLKDEIKKKIKELGFGNIILGIDHYAEILQDKKYFFNYAWSLIDFLKRKNGITNFLEEGSQWQSYVKQSSKYKNKREEEALENWAKKDYQGTTLF